MTEPTGTADEPVLSTTTGGRARLVLNRPQAHNALSPELVRALAARVTAALADPAVRVLTIEGAGPSFCAGADLKALLPLLDDPPALRAYMGQVEALFNGLEASPKPVVAIAHGFVLAGGLELLLACDLAIAAEDTTIGDQHINFGLMPGGGATQRLPRVIGQRRAKGLMLTGARISGAEAQAIGLVNQAVPAENLHAAADALCAKMAGQSPTAMAHIKYLAGLSHDTPLAEGVRSELEVFADYAQHPDFREGLNAFQEKRAPHYGGGQDD